MKSAESANGLYGADGDRESAENLCFAGGHRQGLVFGAVVNQEAGAITRRGLERLQLVRDFPGRRDAHAVGPDDEHERRSGCFRCEQLLGSLVHGERGE